MRESHSVGAQTSERTEVPLSPKKCHEATPTMRGKFPKRIGWIASAVVRWLGPVHGSQKPIGSPHRTTQEGAGPSIPPPSGLAAEPNTVRVCYHRRHGGFKFSVSWLQPRNLGLELRGSNLITDITGTRQERPRRFLHKSIRTADSLLTAVRRARGGWVSVW